VKETFDEHDTETRIHVEESIEKDEEDSFEEKETFEEMKIESEAQEDESFIEKQQDEKETFDEEKIDGGIQNEEQSTLDEKDDIDLSASDVMEVKKKPVSGEDTHNYESPVNDIKQQITDNLVLAGGVLVLILFLCFLSCLNRCCCAPRKKKAYRRLSGPEIEMNRRSLYKDDFVDEDNHDDDAEHGEYKDV